MVAATGVTATAPGGLLTLTGADADTAIDLTGTTGSLITEFGIAVGPTNPTNLLTQGAVTAGQTLTVTIGSNPTLTVTFGTNESAIPPEVSTLAELNAALGTLTGGTATASLVNGNITITGGEHDRFDHGRRHGAARDLRACGDDALRPRTSSALPKMSPAIRSASSSRRSPRP